MLYVTLLNASMRACPDAYAAAVLRPPVKPKVVRELDETDKV